MTQMKRTNSSEVDQMSKHLDLNYPMRDYVLAWKIYRTLSNEDIEIGKRVADFIGRERNSESVLDVGPGDGRVLSRALLLASHRPSLLTIVEPNQSFLEEAIRSLNSPVIASDIRPICKKFGDCSDDELNGPTKILCTHTCYFLTHAEMARLLQLVEAGASLLVVVDAPDSVFTELWNRTAPQYSACARGHIETLETLPRNRFSVRKGQIPAKLNDPFRLRCDVQNLVLSMLCYSEVEDMHAEMLSSVNDCVRRHSDIDNSINCVSNLYEISPRNDLR